jgi:hypothetical protein
MKTVTLDIPDTLVNAEDILNAIDSALATGAPLAARKLAKVGVRRFPNNKELKKMSTLLAPPVVSISDREPNPGIKANRDWLRDNRGEYMGCWVALKNGALLYSAHTMDEIVTEIGELKNTNILVTKVF